MNVVVDMRKSGRKEMIEGCITLFIKELKLEKSKSSLFVFSRKNFEKETGAAGMVYPYAEGLITMDLDSRLGMDKLIHTLAHEMVSIPSIIDKLTRDGRLIKISNEQIKEFKRQYFTNKVKKNFTCNKEDQEHIPVVLLSDRKYVLTLDQKFTDDLLNFPGFRVIVCAKPQDLLYDK